MRNRCWRPPAPFPERKSGDPPVGRTQPLRSAVARETAGRDRGQSATAAGAAAHGPIPAQRTCGGGLAPPRDAPVRRGRRCRADPCVHRPGSTVRLIPGAGAARLAPSLTRLPPPAPSGVSGGRRRGFASGVLPFPARAAADRGRLRPPSQGQAPPSAARTTARKLAGRLPCRSRLRRGCRARPMRGTRCTAPRDRAGLTPLSRPGRPQAAFRPGVAESAASRPPSVESGLLRCGTSSPCIFEGIGGHRSTTRRAIGPV